MRFKPRRSRSTAPSPSDSQTLTSERESLPFPEGGVFGAKPAPTGQATSMKPRRSRHPGGGSGAQPNTEQELNALFNEIRGDLDKLGDLLDEPFRLNPNSTDDGSPNPPRRAA